MLRAIISDIHANLEALLAVIDDFSQFDVDEVFCLGDMVGYGPNPIECLDLCQEGCDLVIMGNHDQAMLFDPSHFSPTAERAVYWTRKQLEKDLSEKGEARWEFLGELPRTHREGEKFLFVHGSALNPIEQYVFPDDIRNPKKMEPIFRAVPQYAFQGHTHFPGIFTDDMQFFSPADVDHRWHLDDRKTMINVGSVGQPRDSDPRACYVLFDGETVSFRRVPYDPTVTRDKIYAIQELENYLGDRLLTGR